MGCASSKDTPTIEVTEPSSRQGAIPAAAPASAPPAAKVVDGPQEADPPEKTSSELFAGLPESPQSKPSQKALQPLPDEDAAKTALEEVNVEVTETPASGSAAATGKAEQADAMEAAAAEQLAGEVVAKLISEAVAVVEEEDARPAEGTIAVRAPDASPGGGEERRVSLIARVSTWASGMLSPRLSLSPQPAGRGESFEVARDRAQSKIKTKTSDMGDNGHLSSKDFESIRRSKKASAAFKKMDKNGDGRLSRAEVIQALRKDVEVRKLLGLEEFETIRQEDGSRDAFEKVFQALDADSNKMIDEKEFSRVLVRNWEDDEPEASGRELTAPQAIGMGGAIQP